MKTIKKIIIIAIILVGVLYKSNDYTITSFKEIKKESDTDKTIHNEISLKIYKYGINDEFLPGVTFKLKSYNNILEWESVENDEQGCYEIIESADKPVSDFNSILSNTQKDFINSIKTTEDISSSVVKSISNIVTDYNNNNNTYYVYDIYLPTAFLLEETNVPPGYIKEKIYVPGTIQFTYRTPSEEDNTLELFSVELYCRKTPRYLKYDDYDEEYLVGIDFRKNDELWQTKSIETNSCALERYKDIPFEAKDFNVNPGNCQLVLKNVKGKISLSVENKVNETISLTTTSNTKLTYKVTLKNTGDIDAVDSILTSRIPTGFEYVEGSVSDGGIYNNGEIQWRVTRLDAKKEKTFTFNVYVPKGTNVSKDYIGESSVSNFAMPNRVDSDKTVVKLLLVNPNTSFPIMIIGGVFILLSLLIPTFINYYKKNKEENIIYDNF